MRYCGFVSNTRARKIDGVGAVGFIFSSYGGVGLVFLQAKYLGTLEVGTTSTEFVPTFEVQ